MNVYNILINFKLIPINWLSINTYKNAKLKFI